MSTIRRLNGNLIIENAHIMYRNFAGKGDGRYNDEGDRNFCVVIDDTGLAEELKSEGWNVRISKPKHPDDEPKYYIPVKVNYDRRPPDVVLISGGVKTHLTEGNVSCLDYADIEYDENGQPCVDVNIRPYNWNRPNGDTGVKAYLKSMYVTIIEDELAAKYADDDLPI